MPTRTKFQSRRIHHFSSCEDPRKHRIHHQLTDIIIITVLAVMRGEDGWEGFYEWAFDKRGYLKQYLSLENGIPFPDTLRRVIERLNPLQTKMEERGMATKHLPKEYIGTFNA